MPVPGFPHGFSPAVLKQAHDDVEDAGPLLFGGSPNGATRAIYACSIVTAAEVIRLIRADLETAIRAAEMVRLYPADPRTAPTVEAAANLRSRYP